MDLSNEGRLPGVEERQISGMAGQGADRFANDQLALAQSCQALLRDARTKPKSARNGVSFRSGAQSVGSSQRDGRSHSRSAEPNFASVKEILDISFEDIFGCSHESSFLSTGNVYDESARMLEFLNRSEPVGH